MTNLPKEIHVWRQDPSDGNGTWSVDRYPEDAQVYVPKAERGSQAVDVEQIKEALEAATDGPWGLGPYAKTGLVIVDNYQNPVCSCHDDPGDANARLIAMAPDLARMALDLHERNRELGDAVAFREQTNAALIAECDDLKVKLDEAVEALDSTLKGAMMTYYGANFEGEYALELATLAKLKGEK